MHECGYHVQAKDEFQFLCIDGWFLKYSHTCIINFHRKTYLEYIGTVIKILFLSQTKQTV